MAIHSSTIAWRIPWTEEPGRLQSMGSQESDMTERLQSVSQSNRYLQSTYCVAGSISGTGNIVENMKGKLSIKDLANYLKKVSEKIYTYNI